MSAPPTQAPLAVIFGAAGFIGRFIVDELIGQRWRVRACVRPSEICLFPDRPDIDVVRGDIREAADVRQAVRGAAIVVNAAGAKSDEPDSEAVNVGGMRNVLAGMAETGCRRLIHLSTQAVKITRQGTYARTKRQAEELLAASNVEWTILRPSVVYGPGRSGVFSTIERAVTRLPVVPVLGDGRWESAPVDVTDVARAVAACLQAPATVRQVYDIAGPDMIAFDALLDAVAAVHGRRIRKLHIPFPLALAATRILAGILPRPPISVSNVLGSNQPIPIDLAAARRDFAFAPRSLREGLRQLQHEHEESSLHAEGTRFGAYLIGTPPPAELADRYVVAARTLFGEAPLDREVAFVRRHPWAIGPMEAAGGALRARSQLRERLYVMAAILEASPVFASYFLQPPPSRPGLFVRTLIHVVVAAIKIGAGLALRPFVGTR